MKVALICFLSFAIATAMVIEKRQCVNHCTQSTNSGCHFGQICMHVNCSHYCEFPIIKKRAGCPMVMCAMYCENGFKKDPNDCFTCSCA